jgi:hypothetical protein
MNNRFKEGFEKGLEIISCYLSKKSGTKMSKKYLNASVIEIE